MIIEKLKLKNIGPFKDVEIDFPTQRNKSGRLPVTIITGVNGSGKTIILDAIRSLLYGAWGDIERDIVSDQEFLIESTFRENTKEAPIIISTTKKTTHRGFETSNSKFNTVFGQSSKQSRVVDWVVSYWTSKISNDSYNIKNLVSPIPENYLLDTLKGVQKNVEVAELICYFDYLKSSDAPDEKELGIFLFKTLKQMN